MGYTSLLFTYLLTLLTSFRRQLLGTLLVQRWRGSSGNVRLSHLLASFFSSCVYER